MLNKNDEIRVIAPSISMVILSEETINNANNVLKSMDLNVSFGSNVMKNRKYYNSASIENRVNDIHAAFKDKNVDAIFQSFSEISKKILVTSFDHVRARHREDYENLLYPYVDDYKEAMRITLARAPKRSIILMTGSLAFIGVVRHDLKEDKKL